MIKKSMSNLIAVLVRSTFCIIFAFSEESLGKKIFIWFVILFIFFGCLIFWQAFVLINTTLYFIHIYFRLSCVSPQPRMHQSRREQEEHSSTESSWNIFVSPFHTKNMFQTFWYPSCWLSSYFHHLCFPPKLLSDQVLNLTSLASMKFQIISCQSGVVTVPGTDASVLLPWCLGESRDLLLLSLDCSCLKYFSHWHWHIDTDTDTLTLTWTALTTHCCCFGESCSCFWSIAAVTESMQTLKMSTTQLGRWSPVGVGVSFYGASFIKPLLQTCFGESLLIMTLDQWKLAPTNDKDW